MRATDGDRRYVAACLIAALALCLPGLSRAGSVQLSVDVPRNPRNDSVALNATIYTETDFPRELQLDFYFYNASAPQPSSSPTLTCERDSVCHLAAHAWYYSPGDFFPVVIVRELHGGRIVGQNSSYVFIPYDIEAVNLELPSVAAGNTSVPLQMDAHPPRNMTGTVKYDLMFGDGFSASTTERRSAHAYDQAGFYNVTLTASNNVSSLAVMKTIKVLVALQNISVTLGDSKSHASRHSSGAGQGRVPVISSHTVALNTDVPFTVLGLPPVEQAEYELLWDFGDGSMPVLSADASLKHRFDRTGRRNVTVVASSPVSRASSWLEVTVEAAHEKSSANKLAVVLPVAFVGCALGLLIFFLVRHHRRKKEPKFLEIADHDFGAAPKAKRPRGNTWFRSRANYGTVEMFDHL